MTPATLLSPHAMVRNIVHWYRSLTTGPYLRPWGLATPILVLVICLPLLRPLRQPLDISDNELARLATIEAIVERHTLAIDETSFKETSMLVGPVRVAGANRPNLYFSKQPPVLAVLLAGPYWVMYRLGLSFDKNLTLTSFLLTLIGSTLPVAMAGGLVYRLGRLFELRRPWRTTLAVTAIFGSGLISYATVLNGHAPAAALILAAVAAMWRAILSVVRTRTCAWILLAGFFAALAAVIDLGAMVFLGLLVVVILVTRWVVAAKVAGVGWYILGAAPPLILHALLTIPMTGDLRPGFLHIELLADRPAVAKSSSLPADSPTDDDEVDSGYHSLIGSHLADGLFGAHGLLSHFPILVLGVAGAGMILRHHWPAATKALAFVSLGGAVLVILGYAVLDAKWNQPMFAARWFIIFTPLLVFWSGAWLRLRHHPVIWALAGMVLTFSIATSLLGAAAPFITTDPGQYTAYAAARQLWKPPSLTPPTTGRSPAPTTTSRPTK